MSKLLRKYTFLCCILAVCSQAGLCINPPDTTTVFHKDSAFNGLLDKAIMYQHKVDSLYTLSIEWRKEVVRMDDPAKRSAWQQRIAEAEDSAAFYRELAGIHFSYANSLIPVEKKRSPYLEKDTVLNGMTVYQYRLTDEFLGKLNEIEQATSVMDEPREEPSHMGINFRIYKESPYSAAQTFEYDFPLPAGVFYRIQLAVYKTRMAADHFKGLAPITTEKIPNRNLIRYFVGKFYRYQDARNALEKVKAYGHPDAYIVGYYNGIRGTIEKLQEMERHP